MKERDLYLEIINNLCDGVYFVDLERRITFWNKAAEEITGYKKEDILGQNCQQNLLNHIDKDGNQLCIYGCPLHASIIDGNQRKAEVFLRHKDGHRVPVRINIFPIKEGNKIIGAIEIFTLNSPSIYDDVLIERLSDMAMSDQLTGLANRRKIESYLEYKLLEFKRFNNRFCVIFMDIDNFSIFNDTYGHKTGDEVLKSVSESIKLSMRKEDMFGRWGGEEFVGIFKIKKDYEAALIAEKLRVLVERSDIVHEGKNLFVTASFGVTVVCNDDTTDSIIKRADLLMYKSKEKGKNCVTSDTN